MTNVIDSIAQFLNVNIVLRLLGIVMRWREDLQSLESDCSEEAGTSIICFCLCYFARTFWPVVFDLEDVLRNAYHANKIRDCVVAFVGLPLILYFAIKLVGEPLCRVMRKLFETVITVLFFTPCAVFLASFFLILYFPYTVYAEFREKSIAGQ